MKNQNFDTFISYRRAGGSLIASRIYDNLRLGGFSPFYDITEMRAGRFDEQLRNNVINASNFILILSKNALDRCVSDKEDWVRKEISLAISHRLNIVLLREADFVFPDGLPEDIKHLPLYQTVTYSENDFHSTMSEICKLLLRKKDVFAISPITNPKSKKLKLSGDYITLYEDIIDGKAVVQKAPASIKHRRNKITGVTSFGDRQEWVLHATIYQGKRIAGIYYAKDVLDEGFGTFFLEIKNGDVLDGYWSGYDNTNRIITSGRYLFKKKYTNYTIHPMRAGNIMNICEIADAQLGQDYVTEELLSDISNDERTMYCDCATDKTTGDVIAFCIYAIISPSEAIAISSDKLKDLKYAKKIGYLKTIATNPDYAGLGIGSSLVEHCINKMAAHSPDLFLSTAWKHAGVINIGGVLEGAGFSKKLEIADYWYESSIADGYQCPQCGNPCRCTCVIYTMGSKHTDGGKHRRKK